MFRNIISKSLGPGTSGSLSLLTTKNLINQPCVSNTVFQRSIHSTAPFLATLNQVKRGVEPPKRKKLKVSPDLENCPIRKGVVLRVMVLKPKKPNSAQRKACRVRLTNGNVISAYIPGEGHNAQEHSIVYVRGGRCQDLPGVKYHVIRGAGDLSGVVNRITSRSKYGVKKPNKE
ncbi:probable 37S ribosomal protein S12, mitochondrial [Saccharomycodes ludwigii]|uniref:Probable 37S ribosomal protein S12, mitochondrial n=1 Tax=Saccharomycodes ludwigii TaxID=36035 RepID=A0A376B677_9ASCO|nr:hypothetical protein SCDLUD_003752 [Saccharomycodes ludwigii]KAH3900747.1 hypothetical protein SCDLUD_003752 [Saccharomycodes ludwigii]SSD60207.1 probable 37S ribosomal protein S12, mitochondrial [Saccharomycodes ludwigii]